MPKHILSSSDVLIHTLYLMAPIYIILKKPHNTLLKALRMKRRKMLVNICKLKRKNLSHKKIKIDDV